jgi:hypothetical protein
MTNLERAALGVAYHVPVKGEFIRQVMIPAARRLSAQAGVDCAHLTRHWRFGPHVQVVLSGTDHDELVRLLVAERPRLEASVARLPSDYSLREVPYLALSSELGKVELVPPPYAPIWPDNSVRLLREPLLPGFVVHPDAADLRDRFCASSLPALESVIARTAIDPGDRLVATTEMLLVAAAAFPDRGLAHGYLSYKSHLEDYLHDNDATGTIRADFEMRYAKVSGAFEELVRRSVEQLDTPASYVGPDPALRSWSASVHETMAAAVLLAGRGRAIDPLLHPGYVDRANELNDDLRRKYLLGDDRTYSAFHSAFRGVEFTDVDAGRGFAAYRFVINHVYSQLLLTDLAPAERLFLCHAVSEAVESVTGSTWQDKLLPPSATQGV